MFWYWGTVVDDMSDQAISSRPLGGSQLAIPVGAAPQSETNTLDSNHLRRSPWPAWWPLTWWRRFRFRARLREYRDEEHLLRDIGIDLYEARSEAVRPFWKKVLLTRR